MQFNNRYYQESNEMPKVSKGMFLSIESHLLFGRCVSS